MTSKIAKRKINKNSHTFFFIDNHYQNRWVSKVLILIVMMLGKNLFLNINKNSHKCFLFDLQMFAFTI